MNVILVSINDLNDVQDVNLLADIDHSETVTVPFIPASKCPATLQ